jgi:hypothetical protein
VTRTALVVALVLLIVVLAAARWTIDAVRAGGRAIRLDRV